MGILGAVVLFCIPPPSPPGPWGGMDTATQRLWRWDGAGQRVRAAARPDFFLFHTEDKGVGVPVRWR